MKRKQWETGADYTLDIIPGRVRTILDGVGGGHPLYGTTTVNDDEWQHIAMTWNGSVQRVFYNGIEDGNRDAAGEIVTGNGNVEIGTFSGDSPQTYFKGTVDDIRIYDRGLIGEEIRLLYNENGWDQ